MNALTLENNFSDADKFYAALIDLHRDLSKEDSEQVNARLILLLANQIGDMVVLQQALDIAADLSNN